MILEHALLSVKAGQENDFESAFGQAKSIIAVPGLACSVASLLRAVSDGGALPAGRRPVVHRAGAERPSRRDPTAGLTRWTTRCGATSPRSRLTAVPFSTGFTSWSSGCNPMSTWCSRTRCRPSWSAALPPLRWGLEARAVVLRLGAGPRRRLRRPPPRAHHEQGHHETGAGRRRWHPGRRAPRLRACRLRQPSVAPAPDSPAVIMQLRHSAGPRASVAVASSPRVRELHDDRACGKCMITKG